MPSDGLSKTTKKTMSRYAQLNEETKTYLLSGFQIAQFGHDPAYEQPAIARKRFLDAPCKTGCHNRHAHERRDTGGGKGIYVAGNDREDDDFARPAERDG